MTLRIYRPPFSLRSAHDILGEKTASIFSSNGIDCKGYDLWPEFPSALMHAGIIPFGIRFFAKAMAPGFAKWSTRHVKNNDIFWVLGQIVPRKIIPKFEANLKKRGAKYIFHIMDDWFEFNHLRQTTILRAELSDLIVVPTPTLFEKVKSIVPHKKVAVLEEPIDTERVFPIENLACGHPELPVVVWNGNPGNLNLLRQIDDFLGSLYKLFKFKLRVISKCPPGFDFACEWEWKKYDYKNEAQLMAGAVAGLAPINDTPHDRSKGVYKAKTYLSAGVPVVGPPFGYLNHLVETKQNGFLCKTKEEWVSSLYFLLSNYEERKRISKYARQCAVGKYSHSAVSSQWLNTIRANFFN
jgi:glycosyltransferase involved in cell wall biosynthesis